MGLHLLYFHNNKSVLSSATTIKVKTDTVSASITKESRSKQNKKKKHLKLAFALYSLNVHRCYPFNPLRQLHLSLVLSFLYWLLLSVIPKSEYLSSNRRHILEKHTVLEENALS